MQAQLITGPANGPLPTSSMPITGFLGDNSMAALSDYLE